MEYLRYPEAFPPCTNQDGAQLVRRSTASCRQTLHNHNKKALATEGRRSQRKGPPEQSECKISPPDTRGAGGVGRGNMCTTDDSERTYTRTRTRDCNSDKLYSMCVGSKVVSALLSSTCIKLFMQKKYRIPAGNLSTVVRKFKSQKSVYFLIEEPGYPVS